MSTSIKISTANGPGENQVPFIVTEQESSDGGLSWVTANVLTFAWDQPYAGSVGVDAGLQQHRVIVTTPSPLMGLFTTKAAVRVTVEREESSDAGATWQQYGPLIISTHAKSPVQAGQWRFSVTA